MLVLAALLLAAPAVPPSAPAAPPPAPPPAAAPATAPVPAAKPGLKPDAEGYCQNTEFIGWSKDGAEAAVAESYCKEPPPDAAWDTLYRVARNGKIRFWLIGEQSGVNMKPETRAKLLFGDSVRKAGNKAPTGPLSATAKVEGDYLIVTFQTANKDEKAPPPATRDLALPYPKMPFDKAPTVGDMFWSPDGGAVAVTVKAVRKEPKGGKLPVAQVLFFEVRPLPPPAPAAAPATPPPAPAPAPKK